MNGATKHFGFSCFAILLALSAGGLLHAAEPPQRPLNIVFFVVDDLGCKDLGCYGSTFYETPHLDQLAAQGAKFTQAYASCPVCSPTRSSLVTGKYPVRTGITDYIGAAQPPQWRRNTPLLPAPYRDRLALEEVTFAEALKQAGYATCFAGKWHLGPQGFYPENQGFDVNHGGWEQGGPWGGKQYFAPYGNPKLKDGPPGEHLPDRLATEVNHFLADHRDQPMLVYLPFYSVHTPLISREDLRQKYEAKRKQLGLKPEWGQEGANQVRLVQEHAVYAGMVEAMDAAVGKVLKQLDELGIADHTLVIFTSDNGGLSTAEGHATSNLPYRGGKGWLYEGGIREPLLIRWPGAVRPGITIDTPVTSPDIYPTILQAAGLPLRPDQHQDGVGLVPLLKAEAPLADRALYWHYPHYGNQGGQPGAAIRRGDWKLIEWFHGPRLELYNLADDPGEQTNLAESHPEKIAALRQELHAWQKATGAVLPTKNPKYAPAAKKP